MQILLVLSNRDADRVKGEPLIYRPSSCTCSFYTKSNMLIFRLQGLCDSAISLQLEERSVVAYQHAGKQASKSQELAQPCELRGHCELYLLLQFEIVPPEVASVSMCIRSPVHRQMPM